MMIDLKVDKLRVEYKENPIGIDVVKPRFSWQLISVHRNTIQTAYQLQVSTEPGFTSCYWESGRNQTDQSIHVTYEGPSLNSCTRYFYRVKVWDNHGFESEWSQTQFFETAFLDPSLWQAKWITPDIEEDTTKSCPAPHLRKEFIIPSDIAQARVYVTSLGLYQLEINGERIGEDLFTPGWTSYEKRIQYQTYDVTEVLKKGSNALGVILGDGWYRGNLGWRVRRNVYGDKVALLLQLHITLADGTKQIVTSDPSWKAATGPILESDIYNGEIYDARLELKGWSSPGFDDTSWSGVSLFNGNGSQAKLIAQQNVPVRRIEELRPKALFKTPSGEQVIDFGQNFVGWIKFKVSGQTGDRVVIEHGEVLDKAGNFYNKNLKTAKARIEYVLKGDPVEVFEPHFTFHGFRYIRIDEYPGAIDPNNFTGVVIHSDMERTGDFECSDPMVNRLFKNVLWGQKGNFLDVPTDCPQRCERLGWTGDAQAFAGTAVLNMNTAPFFTKWLSDLRCDQKENGGVPYIIPNILDEHEHSSSAWGDAATICPWQVYLAYGDKHLLSEQYESMKAWVEYIRSQGENEYLWNTGFHYGDWLALDNGDNSYTGRTHTDLIATAYYAYSTEILYHSAEVLGKTEDYKEYKALHESIVDAFQKEFITPSGRMASFTQTAHVLALMFNLIPEVHRKRCIETLVGLIRKKGYHLDTGFVGTPYLCFVLSDNSFPDVAYRLLLRTDYPSWLYPVTKGATTMWEHWDGIKPDGSFWPADMNSFNHYAYGSVGEWMYKRIGGIEPDPQKPGFKHFFVRPVIDRELKFAKVTYDSMYGRIGSGWNKNESKIDLDLIIPANTEATVVLPKTDDITIDGQNIKDLSDVCYSIQDNHIRISLGSGEYRLQFSQILGS
jgi:alpha-L-rhamnosidase